MLNESLEQYKDINAFEFLEDFPVEAAKYLIKTLRKIGHNVTKKHAQFFVNTTIKGNIKDGIGSGNNRLIDTRNDLDLDLPSGNRSVSGPSYRLEGRFVIIKVAYEKYKIPLMQSTDKFMTQLAEKIKEHYELSSIPFRDRPERKPKKKSLVHRELNPLLQRYGFKLNDRNKNGSYEIRVDGDFYNIDIEEYIGTAWYPYKEFSFRQQVEALERIVGYLEKFFKNRNTNLLRVHLSSDSLFIETGDEEPTKYVFSRFEEEVNRRKMNILYDAYDKANTIPQMILLATLDQNGER